MRRSRTRFVLALASAAFGGAAFAAAPSPAGRERAAAEHVREWLASQTTAAMRGRLIVNISGLKASRGDMLVGLYDSRTEFPGKGKHLINRKLRVSGVTAAVEFTNVPYGEYAVAAIHDRNGNGKLDTRLGILPTEPMGFSNGAKVKFGPPRYRDAAFDFAASEKAIGITVE